MRTKVFLDTNVLLECFVPHRRSYYADTILTAAKSHILEAQVSTQSIIDAGYISRKAGVDRRDFAAFVQELEHYVNIGYVDSFDLDFALKESARNLEDNAQFSCAYRSVCDYFITNDKGLLERPENANLKVITPADFVAAMQPEEPE